ncbi:uncharacterized protein LOC143187016 isoform X2 [Calliopsis andreniformis]|uniref:uncharacterized protein LOC143187016 isoform X2 n=1 Tax=Calliopsis andreniformis TaxID=337506 RepID=UPI003FCD6208
MVYLDKKKSNKTEKPVIECLSQLNLSVQDVGILEMNTGNVLMKVNQIQNARNLENSMKDFALHYG